MNIKPEQIPADGEFHECPHCKGWSRTSAQQPAEAVAVDLEQFRKPVEFWLAHAERMMPGMRTTATTEAPRLLAIIDNAPPAIDIGKLRDAQDVIEGIETLAEGWRDLAAHIRETDKHSPVANELDNCADDVVGTIEAALANQQGVEK